MMKMFAALLSLSALVGTYFVMLQNSTSAPSRIPAPDWIYTRL